MALGRLVAEERVEEAASLASIRKRQHAEPLHVALFFFPVEGRLHSLSHIQKK